MTMISAAIPDLTGLEVLDAIVRRGSMTAAAAELGITQQAASLRIRSIERHVGLQLLLRTAHGSTLTAAGAQLHAWSVSLLDDARELAANMVNLRETQQRRLRIASSLTIAEHLLPAWLVALADLRTRRGRPQAEAELVAINTESVITHVRAGLADIGFIEGPDDPRGVHHRFVAHDQLLIIVAPGHPWARRRSPVTAQMLAQTPMVGREPGSGSRQAFDRALAAVLPAGTIRAAPAMEVSTAAAVRAAVAAGAAPAAVSSLAVADDLTLGRVKIVRTTGMDLHRNLRAIWRGDPRPPAGPVRDLLAIIDRSRLRPGRRPSDAE